MDAYEAERRAKALEAEINRRSGKKPVKRKKPMGASPELAPPGTSGQAHGRLDMGDYQIARRARRGRRSMEKRYGDGDYA